MSINLFEAFYCISPLQSKKKNQIDINSATTNTNGNTKTNNVKFESTRTLFHYPLDVTEISKEFREIPNFCFPDLERLKIDRPDTTEAEHFTFTLQDKDGRRVYGVCMRVHDRDLGQRYNLRRRAKVCYCIITRKSFFKIFRMVLQQIHGMRLICKNDKEFLKYIEVVYNRTKNFTSGKRLIISPSSDLDISHVCNFDVPRHGGQHLKDVSILPLLELLGVDRFLMLMTAILTECRIIFVGNTIAKLSEMVHASIAIVYPFEWQHIFIPLLPSKLLDYTEAPMPYIIGIQRYLKEKLLAERVGKVMLLDVDTGDCTLCGGLTIQSLAYEGSRKTGVDKIKAKASSVASSGIGMMKNLFGKVTGNDSINWSIDNSRDVIEVMGNLLRSALSNKPGKGILGLVQSGSSESKIKWMVQADSTLRCAILIFFSYLFGAIEGLDRNISLSTSGSASASISPFKKGKNFDELSYYVKRLANQRANSSDSFALKTFVSVFMESQMFERFCSERNTRFNLNQIDSDDAFLLILRRMSLHHRKEGLCNLQSIMNIVKSVITEISQRDGIHASLNGDSNSGNDDVHDLSLGSDYHTLTLTLTMQRTSEIEFIHGVRNICNESANAASLHRILNSIELRLRDSNPSRVYKAGRLLQALLFRGSEAAFSGAMSLIRVITQRYKELKAALNAGSTLTFTKAFSRNSEGRMDVDDACAMLYETLSWLYDHNRVVNKRQWCKIQSNSDIINIKGNVSGNSNIIGSNGGYQLNIERVDATHKTPLDRLLSMTSPTSTFINANTSTNLSNPAGPSSSSSYSNGINNSGSSGMSSSTSQDDLSVDLLGLSMLPPPPPVPVVISSAFHSSHDLTHDINAGVVPNATTATTSSQNKGSKLNNSIFDGLFEDTSTSTATITSVDVKSQKDQEQSISELAPPEIYVDIDVQRNNKNRPLSQFMDAGADMSNLLSQNSKKNTPGSSNSSTTASIPTFTPAPVPVFSATASSTSRSAPALDPASALAPVPVPAFAPAFVPVPTIAPMVVDDIRNLIHKPQQTTTTSATTTSLITDANIAFDTAFDNAFSGIPQQAQAQTHAQSQVQTLKQAQSSRDEFGLTPFGAPPPLPLRKNNDEKANGTNLNIANNERFDPFSGL